MSYVFRAIRKFPLISLVLLIFSLNQGFSMQIENIRVRESTKDIQISVDDKIFVFGKDNGNLDKVKVGMDVLSFSQVPQLEGVKSTYQKFAWKRTKDGNIQIRSFYAPESLSLVWTIFKDGKLKFEAKGGKIESSEFLGLGFDFQEQLIKEIHWKNSTFQSGHLLVNSEVDRSEVLQVERFSTLELEFGQVRVGITTETPDSHFRIFANNDKEQNSVNSQSDLNFIFYSIPNQFDSSGLLTPGADDSKPRAKDVPNRAPIILWFDFQ